MKLSEMFVSKKTEMCIRQMYEKNEADKRIRQLKKNKVGLFITVMVAALAVSIPVFVSSDSERKQPVTELERNGSGLGSRVRTLRVLTDEGYEDSVTVEVKERKYTDEEILGFSDSLDEKLWTYILGNNTDPENVMYDLNFTDHIEGYPFRISYTSDHPLLVGSRGIIDEKKLKEEDPDDNGTEVRLCARLKYGDYTEEKYSYIVLHKRLRTAQESIRETIADSIEETGKLTETDNAQVLPDRAGGHGIIFYQDRENKGWTVLIMGIVTAFLLMAVKDRKIMEAAEERRKQLESDHPNILNQYMLYYMAGMNPRSIWYAICQKYEEGLDKAGKGRRYAYEEMIAARNRMDEGCGELTAYDGFAARCDNVRYRSFVSLVKQAVVKGNDGLYEQLDMEMDKALREMNNRVKIRASEAETKLLLPMFMMLAVVLVIVMIPAFMGLNG